MKPQMEPKIKPAYLIAGYPVDNQHIQVSIDKFSLTGFLKKDFSLPDWEAINMDVGERFSGGSLYRYSWKTDDYFFQYDPLTKDHEIRLEFNPNNVTYTPSLLALIKSLKVAKMTRIDLAVDYIDNLIFSEYFVNSPDKSKTTYENRKRNLTGWIFGSLASETMYRVYDKKAEVKYKKDLEIDCKTWWRIEMMIRPKNGKIWSDYSPFEDITIANIREDDPSIDPVDQAVLCWLYADPKRINKFAEFRRRKYKKMMKNETMLDSLSLEHHPYYIIKHARTWLDDQITSFLNRP